MQDESIPDEPNEQERKWDSLERDALYLLADPQHYPPIWSVPDIGRELDHFDAEAVILPLRNAGLVHQTSDGFVFATPAAFKIVQMVGQVI
jgi:hypothetical protein